MPYQECKIPDCGNPVFAAALCRKHYDKERLATAPPCSFSGCTAKAFRAGKCEPHYRADLMAKRPQCIVPNCGHPQLHLGWQLCRRHAFRARRHGAIEQPRPADWGAREAHPMYQTWTYHRRLRGGMHPAWQSNFWEFVSVVGDRPAGFTLRRKDRKFPLGPDNWFWKESVSNRDPLVYMQDWLKRNPDLAKNNSLKRAYGMTLAQYEALGESQGWRCAICNDPETSRHRDGGPRLMPVDHDHTTGKIRALLCTACNRGLGMFRDSPERLEAAAGYLRRHKAATEG